MTDSNIETHVLRLRRLRTLADTYQARTGEALMDAGQYATLSAAIDALEAQDAALPPTTEQNMRFGMPAERYAALVGVVGTLLDTLDLQYGLGTGMPAVDAVRLELSRNPF